MVVWGGVYGGVRWCGFSVRAFKKASSAEGGCLIIILF